jgi:exodeoxyribonuclease V beta subunit
MTPYLEFDPVTVPLQGTHIIEASAGTGKTYTISSLFVRLIVETGLTVNQVLVVTFTKAATEELRERIRGRITDAMGAFTEGGDEDPFLDRLAKGTEDRDRSLSRLKRALQSFDEAEIFTIHGFCQRLLAEHAFETGALFDTELETRDTPFQLELVHDFWRTHLYPAESEFVNYVLGKKIKPDTLLSLLKRVSSHPDISLIPEVMSGRLDGLGPLRETFQALKQVWPRERDSVFQTLMEAPLNGTIYGTLASRKSGPPTREVKTSELISAADRLMASAQVDVTDAAIGGIERLSHSELSAATRKGGFPPENPVFHLFDNLLAAGAALREEMDRSILYFKAQLLRSPHDRLKTKKRRRNIRTFIDLLTDTRDALVGSCGPALVRAIRRKYGAAMIDEFQDTDPVQYEIFKTLFGGEGFPLFLIGDPKQAIYGFRGADVFTYMEAVRTLPARYTLRENWRSEPGLITAVNALFNLKEKPFLFDEIGFTDSRPGEKQGRENLTFDGRVEPPFRLWLMETEEDTTSKDPTKAKAREIIPWALSQEIARLLRLGRENRALIGNEPLREHHIAVLVRKNREARMVQAALVRKRIPSVLFSAGSLFESREALEMERVMGAVAAPENEPVLRGALATDMLGFDLQSLAGLLEEGQGLEKIVERFRGYHETWKSRGFIVMFRYLLEREGVRARLLSHGDGERRLTNLLHLSEVLQTAALENRLGMRGLLKWLTDQRESGAKEMDEHQLRLESDEAAVQIVTVHKSKGLEYPIVFCPFQWDGSRIGDGEIAFHDESAHRRLTLDMGSPQSQAHKLLAERETLAEDLRLLYVALTRARNRCYLVWGKIRGSATSAPAYLFHGPFATPGREMEETQRRVMDMTNDQIRGDLNRLQQAAGGTIGLSGLPELEERRSEGLEQGGRELACRRFSAAVAQEWRIWSFSALSAHEPLGADDPDHDAGSDTTATAEMEMAWLLRPETLSGIFEFPRGARAGTFLHDVMEHLDFAAEDPSSARSLIDSKLKEHGFEARWAEAVAEMIPRVLEAPLDPTIKGLKLKGIEKDRRFDEWEFHFPLRRVSPERLGVLFQGSGYVRSPMPETIGSLHFAPIKGFMKGYVDLIFEWGGRFHLIDWKSNFLGPEPQAYSQEALAGVMQKEAYTVQSIIYTLALDQYLRSRLPDYGYETHFGGAYYVFLRGVEPELGPDFGIYRMRPSSDRIESLRAELMDV